MYACVNVFWIRVFDCMYVFDAGVSISTAWLFRIVTNKGSAATVSTATITEVLSRSNLALLLHLRLFIDWKLTFDTDYARVSYYTVHKGVIHGYHIATSPHEVLQVAALLTLMISVGSGWSIRVYLLPFLCLESAKSVS